MKLVRLTFTSFVSTQNMHFALVNSKKKKCFLTILYRYSTCFCSIHFMLNTYTKHRKSLFFLSIFFFFFGEAKIAFGILPIKWQAKQRSSHFTILHLMEKVYLSIFYKSFSFEHLLEVFELKNQKFQFHHHRVIMFHFHKSNFWSFFFYYYFDEGENLKIENFLSPFTVIKKELAESTVLFIYFVASIQKYKMKSSRSV